MGHHFKFEVSQESLFTRELPTLTNTFLEGAAGHRLQVLQKNTMYCIKIDNKKLLFIPPQTKLVCWSVARTTSTVFKILT